MKNKIITMVMVFVIWSLWSTFAWWGWGSWDSVFTSSTSSSKKNLEIIKNSIKDTPSETITNQIDNQVKILKHTKNIKQKDFLEKQINKKKKLQILIKKNKRLKQKLEKINNETQELKATSKIASIPVTNVAIKTTIQDQLSNLSNQSMWSVSSSVADKLWWINELKSFNLDTTFNPNKVVTFNDIKMSYIWSFTVDQQLLHCDNPDDSVMWLCNNISNLLSDLTVPNKRLTINDIYKLQLYSATISKAIFYEWTLAKYKAWAVVLWINKKTNTLKSIDIVRNYSSYDTADNDLLPFVANEVDINITNTVPVINPNNLEIVLWLNGWSVRWIRISPTDSNLSVPDATSYKVMTIKWWTNGCSDNKYTDSIWYGPWQIGLSHNWLNLEPSWTKGVELNLSERCYKVFDKLN